MGERSRCGLKCETPSPNWRGGESLNKSCVQRMASEISRPDKGRVKLNVVVLKLVATMKLIPLILGI